MYIKQLLSGLLMLNIALGFPALAKAEQVTINASGVYIVGDNPDENFALAKERARNEAKRSAAEQAGIYVESVSKTTNMVLTQDEITSVSAKVLKIQSEDTKFSPAEDGKTIIATCTITALVDTDTIDLKKLLDNKELIFMNTEMQKELNLIKAENAKLKERLATSTLEFEKADIKASLDKNETKFRSMEILGEGQDLADAYDYYAAIAKYNEVIEINPYFAGTYDSRGYAYYKLKDYDNAIRDFEKAISINPKHSQALYHKALANLDKKIKNKDTYNIHGDIIKPVNAAIAIDSNNAMYYAVLGDGYKYDCTRYSGFSSEAKNGIMAYTNALRLDKGLVNVYLDRAWLYCYLQDYVNSVVDCNKYIELVPEDYRGYNARARAFKALQQYDKAQSDYTRVLVANPQASWAYLNRGRCMFEAGALMEAKSDVARALELEPANEEAKKLYQEINIKLNN